MPTPPPPPKKQLYNVWYQYLGIPVVLKFFVIIWCKIVQSVYIFLPLISHFIWFLLNFRWESRGPCTQDHSGSYHYEEGESRLWYGGTSQWDRGSRIEVSEEKVKGPSFSKRKRLLEETFDIHMNKRLGFIQMTAVKFLLQQDSLNSARKMLLNCVWSSTNLLILVRLKSWLSISCF